MISHIVKRGLFRVLITVLLPLPWRRRHSNVTRWIKMIPTRLKVAMYLQFGEVQFRLLLPNQRERHQQSSTGAQLPRHSDSMSIFHLPRDPKVRARSEQGYALIRHQGRPEKKRRRTTEIAEEADDDFYVIYCLFGIIATSSYRVSLRYICLAKKVPSLRKA
jgi:hypothetical protein